MPKVGVSEQVGISAGVQTQVEDPVPSSDDQDIDFKSVLRLIRTVNDIDEGEEKIRKRPRSQLRSTLHIEEKAKPSHKLPPSSFFIDNLDVLGTSLGKFHA